MNRLRFSYWFPGVGEKGEALAFYSLPMGSGDSHVCAETLMNNKMHVPPTPGYKEWQFLVDKKRRCGKCFNVTRTPTDWKRHMELKHSLGGVLCGKEKGMDAVSSRGAR